MQPDAFSSFHPAVTFVWFVCAIVLVVIIQNPAWIAVAGVAAASLYLMVRGRSGWRVVLGFIPVFAVLAMLNGFFNARGDTVLFVYFGRPYTAEALAYGTQTAGMFVSIMLLFGSYNRIMTSDKFMYLFAGLAPAITLVLTLALRLVPDYLRKATQISGARDCIGKGAAEGGFMERVESGASVLGALTAWALESGIITADSMRSRGFVASRNGTTHFASYRFGALNVGMLVAFAMLAALVMTGLLQGAAAMEFFPVVQIPSVSLLGTLSFVAFAVFMFIPFAIDLWERISWRNSISRI